MTRINVVPPEELTREHLIAEYRELPRLFALIRAAIARGEQPDDPRNPTYYRLGKGHVRFFYNKQFFLYERFLLLVGEMLRRGYTVNFAIPPVSIADRVQNPEWWQHYVPSDLDMAINRERILMRLSGK